jgi:hypothetical protein
MMRPVVGEEALQAAQRYFVAHVRALGH